MTKQLKEGINVNTVLLTIILALSGWTLNTVNTLEKSSAKSETRIDHLFNRVQGIDERLSSTARELMDHRLENKP